MKVSRLLWVCLVATCPQIVGCGDQADTFQREPAAASGAPGNDAWSESAGASGAQTDTGSPSLTDTSARSDTASESPEAAKGATNAECPDPCAEQTSCGQICITLKGPGSSCELLPTVNDLTRPPRGVQFDCSPIPRAANGYDFGAQGHITLMGDTCDALHKGGPHRVALILACPPA